MKPPELLKIARARLRASATPDFAEGVRKFFREPVNADGVRAPHIKEVARFVYGEVKHWPVEAG